MVANNARDLKLALEHQSQQINKPLGKFLVDEHLVPTQQLHSALIVQHQHLDKKQ